MTGVEGRDEGALVLWFVAVRDGVGRSANGQGDIGAAQLVLSENLMLPLLVLLLVVVMRLRMGGVTLVLLSSGVSGRSLAIMSEPRSEVLVEEAQAVMAMLAALVLGVRTASMLQEVLSELLLLLLLLVSKRGAGGVPVKSEVLV